MHGEVDGLESPVDDCSTFDITGWLSEGDAGWTLNLAPRWGFSSTQLEPIEEGYRASGEVVDDWSSNTFAMELPLEDCQTRLLLSELTVTPTDGDGDGLVDAFSATGQGEWDNAPWAEGVSSGTMELTLTAVLDSTPPTLTLPAHALHPLDAVNVDASEPLAAGSSVTLAGTSALELVGGSEPFWAFEIPPLMSFDGTWTAEASAEDLAGHLLPAPGELHSLPDPGILAQDGFETSNAATTVAPIAGSRSLLVAGQRVTFHLARGAGNTLRFSARTQWSSDVHDFADVDEFQVIEVKVGVVGGTTIDSQSLAWPTLNGFDGQLEAVEEIEIPLSDSGSDVIVSFEMDEESDDCGLALCEDAPALIDDLRIE